MREGMAGDALAAANTASKRKFCSAAGTWARLWRRPDFDIRRNDPFWIECQSCIDAFRFPRPRANPDTPLNACRWCFGGGAVLCRRTPGRAHLGRHDRGGAVRPLRPPGRPAAAAPAAPAAKMAAPAAKQHTAASLECSKEADAKGLHGKERKKFRSECKKGAAKPN